MCICIKEYICAYLKKTNMLQIRFVAYLHNQHVQSGFHFLILDLKAA